MHETRVGMKPEVVYTKAAPKKRGPQSQLEKQMAAIASLPRKEQRQLLAVVEAFISQHATQ